MNDPHIPSDNDLRNTLLALAERCERATGADRELDAAIWLALCPGSTRREFRYTHKATGKECVIDETRDASRRLINVPAYTASLDAAIALTKGSVLLSLSDIGADGLPLCRLGDPSTTPCGEWFGVGATLALSVVSAALRVPAAME